MLGLKKNSTSGKRTVIILIDGLSYKALSAAISLKKCPTIARLLKKKYRVHSYYCGLPAATTSTEALLFYGNNRNIPGFTWYDRDLSAFVRGNRSAELSAFEDAYPKKRELLHGGSAIMSVYTGGASQLMFTGRNLSIKKKGILLKVLQYVTLGLLYPVQFFRTVFLALKTIIFYKRSERQAARRVFETIFLGQFSCFLTEVEIYRHTPRIFVDFLLYDEYAHEHGPTHPTTFSALHLIDRYIKRIVTSIKASGLPYELIILSDHGQTESMPYDDHVDRSIEDIEDALQNKSVKVVKTYGADTEEVADKKIYAVPAGSTLQLYFTPLRKPLFKSDITTLYPQLFERMITKKAFGWILVRTGETSFELIGKHGSVLFEHRNSPRIIGKPFPHMSTKESDRLIRSLQHYGTFPNNGDVVLFGDVRAGKVYSFEKHKGTHGGFFGDMCYPFCITCDNTLIEALSDDSATMDSLFHKIEYNMS
jgi:hypothetical protein